MPTLQELGQRVKAKYPGQYDDLDDVSLARKVQVKFPGQYDDFTDTQAFVGPKPTAEWTLRSQGTGARMPSESEAEWKQRLAETDALARREVLTSAGKLGQAVLGLPTTADMLMGGALQALRDAPRIVREVHPIAVSTAAIGGLIGGRRGAEIGGALPVIPPLAKSFGTGMGQGVGIPVAPSRTAPIQVLRPEWMEPMGSPGGVVPEPLRLSSPGPGVEVPPGGLGPGPVPRQISAPVPQPKPQPNPPKPVSPEPGQYASTIERVARQHETNIIESDTKAAHYLRSQNVTPEALNKMSLDELNAVRKAVNPKAKLLQETPREGSYGRSAAEWRKHISTLLKGLY